MRRGKLRREEGDDGTVYVILDGRATAGSGPDGSQTVNGGRGSGEPTGSDGPADGQGLSRDGLASKILHDQVDHLKDQLDKEREASAELRRIIAGLVQRVPELEAPLGPRDGRETASAAGQGVDNWETPGGPQTDARRRSWWRRFFGFE